MIKNYLEKIKRNICENQNEDTQFILDEISKTEKRLKIIFRRFFMGIIIINLF